MDLNELQVVIRDEADEILNEIGLINVLNRFGNFFIGGSYFLELMTWRDLDIYVDGDNIDIESFFEIGKDLSLCLKPLKMNYRNEYIGRTDHLPRGLYWGCHTMFNFNTWKVDIWSISSEDFNQKQQESVELKAQIQKVDRKTIMKLKYSLFSHPLYRKKFFSVDIYDAVLKNEIHSEEKFKDWLYRNKSIK